MKSEQETNRQDMPASEVATSQNVLPSQQPLQTVAERAYFIYLNSGSPQGCELQHWLKAEQELMVENPRIPVHCVHN